MIVSVYVGGDKLDLYKDESINVNSSVSIIEDITKNKTDYTKTFTVPSSKGNDKIFKHWYNVNVDNSFDARIKVDAEIHLDGMLFRKGKMRLHKVSLKHNNPSSYTINFWGNLLDLKDKLGKDELRDLDLSAFNHNYDSATVKTGLQGSLISGDVVYSAFAKKQYYYNSDITDTFISDTLANIGWGDGSGSNGILWNDLNPSLRAIKIIEAIETKYSIVFSRDFFGRSEFSDLFVWMNNTKEVSIGGGTQQIDWDGGSTNNINLTTDTGSYDVSNTSASNDDFYWFLHTTITPSVGYETADYTIRVFVDGEQFSETSFDGGTNTVIDRLRVQNAPENPHTYNVTWEVQSNQEFKYTASVLQRHHQSGTVINAYTTTATESTIVSNFEASDHIPKIKTIDFLKGLFNMFKLVVIPQIDGSLYVNTLNDFYAEGKVYDVSKYIDYSSYSVQRGKILNEIDYKYQEPQTILNRQFEKNTRIAYGDSETTLQDENGEVLDGGSLKFTLPFEQILYERLTDQNDLALTNFQYGAVIDEELSPVNPKLHFHYVINQSIGSKTIAIINDVGVKEQMTGNINLPSHTIGFTTSNFSTLFDAEYSTWNGALINNTLYKNYHERYILSIFNVKKRSFSFTAKNLPLRILLDLKLNDLLKIEENYYRINSFNTDLTTRDVKLDLINSFDETIVGSVALHPLNFFISSQSQTVSSYANNLDVYTPTKVDTGFGTSWITVTDSGGNIYFDVDENLGATERNMIIQIASKGKIEEIYINQEV